MSESTRKTGDRGELIAIDYLQRHDYEIIGTNVSASRGGEIDIIADKDGLTIFFEVKYRRGDSHGSAIESFTPAKRHKFLFAVRWYCMTHRISEDHIRADFIAIQRGPAGHRVTHIQCINLV